MRRASRCKRLAKGAITSVSHALVRLGARSAIGRFAIDKVLDAAVHRVETIRHHGLNLVFAVPNTLNSFRVSAFATKEPETLEWIDSLPHGSVLWDIGANVGHYSCYAAKARGCRVFAFEPSVFNLELLTRNVYLNGLTRQVTIVPLPLTDVLGASTLNMTSTEWGGALSTFGREYGFDGMPLQKTFEFKTYGISMDDAMDLLKLPQPAYIKMDVDGLEHVIIAGGARVLDGVQGVSIEINDAFEQQATESARQLERAGLRFVHKKHSGMFESKESAFVQTFNQVWARPSAEMIGKGAL